MKQLINKANPKIRIIVDDNDLRACAGRYHIIGYFDLSDRLWTLEDYDEWSEEDEKMCGNLIGIMDGKMGILPEGWGKYSRWVLSLRQRLHPELAESEDERIRKHLIEIVEIYWGDTNEEGKVKDLAYLEKQKEQKPAEWSEEDKQKLNRIYSILGMAADTHAYSTTCRLIGDKEAVELQDFLRSITKPQTEQKWSEEDEENLDAAIEMAEHTLYEPLVPRDTLVSWLKSLRPQSKHLSKEDKVMLGEVIKAINFAADRYFFDGGEHSATDIKSWLLDAVHPHWKPSEEDAPTWDLIETALGLKARKEE